MKRKASRQPQHPRIELWAKGKTAERLASRPPDGQTPGSHLHVKQIELDWISGVHVLVRVEELAPEEEGLVLVHALLSEGPAVIQPVHWQKKPQEATMRLMRKEF